MQTKHYYFPDTEPYRESLRNLTQLLKSRDAKNGFGNGAFYQSCLDTYMETYHQLFGPTNHRYYKHNPDKLSFLITEANDALSEILTDAWNCDYTKESEYEFLESKLAFDFDLYLDS